MCDFSLQLSIDQVQDYIVDHHVLLTRYDDFNQMLEQHLRRKRVFYALDDSLIRTVLAAQGLVIIKLSDVGIDDCDNEMP